jgi:hypothetical protein
MYLRCDFTLIGQPIRTTGSNATPTRLQQKRIGMTEQEDHRSQQSFGQERINQECVNQEQLSGAREEIAARIASFRATQEKFEREREEYFETTMEKARRTARPSFWP